MRLWDWDLEVFEETVKALRMVIQHGLMVIQHGLNSLEFTINCHDPHRENKWKVCWFILF